MEIVIKIDENIYKSIKNNGCIYEEENEEVALSIIGGTPLPNGHGDLIDRRELKKDVYTTTEWNGDVHRIIYEASIDDASTIIEADTESEG